jgi:hypothetical protein
MPRLIDADALIEDLVAAIIAMAREDKDGRNV